jgi:hypothetical protein
MERMHMKRMVAGLLVVASCAFAAPASAITFTGGFTVSPATQDPGLVVNSAPMGPGTINFELNEVGQSTGLIDLFSIWTDETAVNSDDLAPQGVSVGFNFSEPAPAFSGSVDGSSAGHTAIFGLVQWGSVSWSNALMLSFGNGGTGKLLVYLSDEIFNLGLFGLSEGPKHGATVQANFVLAAAPVPIPAAMGLFAAGVVAFGLWARKRRRSMPEEAVA